MIFPHSSEAEHCYLAPSIALKQQKLKCQMLDTGAATKIQGAKSVLELSLRWGGGQMCHTHVFPEDNIACGDG